MNALKLSIEIDPHSALAEKLFRKVTKTGRTKVKEINYMRDYGASEISAGAVGQFPPIDFTSLELRLLTFYA